AARIFEKYRLKERGANWIISALAADRCYCTGWITIFMGPSSNKDVVEAAWQELKKIEMETGGAVPYWNGPLWEEETLRKVSAGFYEALKRIKKALDPNSILHPMVFGL
ncbi:MAG: hypothetical protein ACTSUS_08155, partial [Candidatus Freyarchaeota archaeon]